jgi:hypothetical protein
MEELVDRLDRAFAPIGPAHHAAFIDTDGFDPDWALWYARHAAAEVREILDQPELTESRLVWAFISAADAHAVQGADAPWPRFYAEWFVRELATATG